MKIFKLRAWEMSSDGEQRIIKDDVYINNYNKHNALDDAIIAIRNNKHTELFGSTIYVELFVPKVWGCGKLAHFPEDESDEGYLIKYKTGSGVKGKLSSKCKV